MKTAANIVRRLRFSLFSVPVLLAGCATNGTYRELVREFEANEHTAYYQHAVATHQEDQAHFAEKDQAPFLDQVRSKLLASKQRWEAVLAKPDATVRSRPDQEPGNPEQYRELARDPSLSDRLAAGVAIETLLGLVSEMSPSVQAAREELRATLEQYPQAAYLDDILKQYNAFSKQLDTKIGPSRHKKMAAKSFPFPDALALKGKVVSEDVEIAQRQREIVLRDAITAMRTAYYSYIFIDAAIVINRENQELLEQMIRVAQAKLRVDRAKYSAVIMAQVELSKLSDEIITLEERRGTVIARINTLLNRPPDTPLGPPQPVTDVDLDLPLDALYEVAIRDRQELRQQRLRINKMNTMVELATRMAYPDPTTGASYLENRMRLTGGTDQAAPPFMTQRELNHRQTPWFGQSDAYIREIKTRSGAMSKMLTAMEDRTRFEVKQAYFGLDTAKRSIALYRQSLLPQARQALEATSAGYRAGKTDFLTFLDAERTLLKFRLAEHAALRDHRTQLARLEQLAGHPLPRQPFQLDAENKN